MKHRTEVVSIQPLNRPFYLSRGPWSSCQSCSQDTGLWAGLVSLCSLHAGRIQGLLQTSFSQWCLERSMHLKWIPRYCKWSIESVVCLNTTNGDSLSQKDSAVISSSVEISDIDRVESCLQNYDLRRCKKNFLAEFLSPVQVPWFEFPPSCYSLESVTSPAYHSFVKSKYDWGNQFPLCFVPWFLYHVVVEDRASMEGWDHKKGGRWVQRMKAREGEAKF